VTLSTVGGNSPIAIVALGDMTLMGTIDGHGTDIHPAPGGSQSIAGQDGSGPGGGPKGTTTFGAWGGSFCGRGGSGAIVKNSGATVGSGSLPSGTPDLIPLRGGASGGGGASSQGGGGGAGLQLVAGGTFKMTMASYINVGGGGGGYGVTGGGGGAGGALLIEASSITLDMGSVLAANGGGGGGSGAALDVGKNGGTDGVPAAGGAGTGMGGPGSGTSMMDAVGADPPLGEGVAGGGGGGAGRIRLNATTLDLKGNTFPVLALTNCVTQGTMK
jgi:hypothetical protein